MLGLAFFQLLCLALALSLLLLAFGVALVFLEAALP